MCVSVVRPLARWLLLPRVQKCWDPYTHRFVRSLSSTRLATTRCCAGPQHSALTRPCPRTPQADGTRLPFPSRHAHDARVLIISSSIIMLLQNTTATASRRGRGRSPASLLLAGLCLLGLFLGGQGAEDYYKILVRAWLVWSEEGRQAEGWRGGGRWCTRMHECLLSCGSIVGAAVAGLWVWGIVSSSVEGLGFVLLLRGRGSEAQIVPRASPAHRHTHTWPHDVFCAVVVLSVCILSMSLCTFYLVSKPIQFLRHANAPLPLLPLFPPTHRK